MPKSKWTPQKSKRRQRKNKLVKLQEGNKKAAQTKREAEQAQQIPAVSDNQKNANSSSASIFYIVSKTIEIYGDYLFYAYLKAHNLFATKPDPSLDEAAAQESEEKEIAQSQSSERELQDPSPAAVEDNEQHGLAEEDEGNKNDVQEAADNLPQQEINNQEPEKQASEAAAVKNKIAAQAPDTRMNQLRLAAAIMKSLEKDEFVGTRRIPLIAFINKFIIDTIDTDKKLNEYVEEFTELKGIYQVAEDSGTPFSNYPNPESQKDKEVAFPPDGNVFSSKKIMNFLFLVNKLKENSEQSIQDINDDKLKLLDNISELLNEKEINLFNLWAEYEEDKKKVISKEVQISDQKKAKNDYLASINSFSETIGKKINEDQPEKVLKWLQETAIPKLINKRSEWTTSQKEATKSDLLHNIQNRKFWLTEEHIHRLMPKSTESLYVSEVCPSSKENIQHDGHIVSNEARYQNSLEELVKKLKDGNLKHFIIPLCSGSHFNALYITKATDNDDKVTYKAELFEPYGSNSVGNNHLGKKFTEELLRKLGLSQPKITILQSTGKQSDHYTCGDRTVIQSHLMVKRWKYAEGVYDKSLSENADFSSKPDKIRQALKKYSSSLNDLKSAPTKPTPESIRNPEKTAPASNLNTQYINSFLMVANSVTGFTNRSITESEKDTDAREQQNTDKSTIEVEQRFSKAVQFAKGQVSGEQVFEDGKAEIELFYGQSSGAEFKAVNQTNSDTMNRFGRVSIQKTASEQAKKVFEYQINQMLKGQPIDNKFVIRKGKNDSYTKMVHAMVLVLAEKMNRNIEIKTIGYKDAPKTWHFFGSREKNFINDWLYNGNKQENEFTESMLDNLVEELCSLRKLAEKAEPTNKTGKYRNTLDYLKSQEGQRHHVLMDKEGELAGDGEIYDETGKAVRQSNTPGNN